MATKTLQFFIITGEPGVGKTTLIKKLMLLLKDKNIETRGFYTEEIRANKVRNGFDVVSLDGQRGPLARIVNSKNPVKFKLGKYEVLIEEFEKIALPLFLIENIQILVIDEIGKMEFFSKLFKNKIKYLFESSNTVILATIPIMKGVDPLIENIRNNHKSQVWVVTRENRNIIHEDIINAIETTVK